MQATFDEISVGILKGYRVNLKNSSMQVISDYGCNLNDLVLNGQKVLHTNDTYELLSQNKGSRSSLLIPFPGRIDFAKYYFEGKNYELAINRPAEGNAIHGLLYNQPYQIVSHEMQEEKATVTFKRQIKENDFQGYPFNVLVEITFELEPQKLTISVHAKNTGTNTAPYGIGWHPYVVFPKPLAEYNIEIPSHDILAPAEHNPCIPTGEIIPQLSLPISGQIGETRFDYTFAKLTSNECQVENVKFFWSDNFDFLQIHTPPTRDAFAVEPLSCAPDGFNNKMGLTILQAGDSVRHSFGVKLT